MTAVLAMVGLLVLTACAEGGPAPDPGAAGAADAADVTAEEGIEVVATTSILGDIVGQLLGEADSVTVLIPPGTDPHAFEPSAAEAAMLREADLVVANGLGLEEELQDALAAASEDGAHVFEVAPHLEPRSVTATSSDGRDGHHPGPDGQPEHGPDEHEGDDEHDAPEQPHDHDHGPQDPHVWFDPVRMAEGVELIAAELAASAPGSDGGWQERAAAYREELLGVHAEMQALFDQIPADDRKLVTNHETLGYLADRYGFEVVGTVVPGLSSQSETSAGQFAELIGTLQQQGATTVFTDVADATSLADQLAAEVAARSDLDIEVVPLHTESLGEPGSGVESYLDLLRTTAQRITDALR